MILNSVQIIKLINSKCLSIFLNLLMDVGYLQIWNISELSGIFRILFTAQRFFPKAHYNICFDMKAMIKHFIICKNSSWDRSYLPLPNSSHVYTLPLLTKCCVLFFILLNPSSIICTASVLFNVRVPTGTWSTYKGLKENWLSLFLLLSISRCSLARVGVHAYLSSRT